LRAGLFFLNIEIGRDKGKRKKRGKRGKRERERKRRIG
jgi:hypothetical protein